jgi:hypothetical protein
MQLEYDVKVDAGYLTLAHIGAQEKGVKFRALCSLIPSSPPAEDRRLPRVGLGRRLSVPRPPALRLLTIELAEFREISHQLPAAVSPAAGEPNVHRRVAQARRHYG